MLQPFLGVMWLSEFVTEQVKALASEKASLTAQTLLKWGKTQTDASRIPGLSSYGMGMPYTHCTLSQGPSAGGSSLQPVLG